MQPVNSTSPTGTGGGGENVNRAGGQPVVDLLQIYPGKTNNLDILTFQDLNVMESRPLCCSSCDMCGLRLRNYEEFMMGLISSVAVILFIAMWIIVGEVASWWYNEFWYLLFWMMPCTILIISKLYTLRKFMLFRREKHANSVEYHRLGREFYFSFYGDAMFSLLASAWWFVTIFHFCIFYAGIVGSSRTCNYLTSFDENIILATITWFGMVPLLIYSIAGYFLVYRMRDSDFEAYNKNWAKRRWDMTNDVKFMLNYHHTAALPATNTVLCRTVCGCSCPCCNSGRDCSYDTYSCCCDCCNTCDGVGSCCCCGTDCCSDGVKCSLIAISVYFIVISTGSLYFLLWFFYYLTYALVSSWWWYYFFFYGLQFLIFFLAGGGYHFLPGYYGIALVNYKFKCCKTGNAAISNSSVEFHNLAMKASKAYAALAALYYYAFMVYFFMFTIPRWFWYFNISSFIEIGLYAFISWLPFEALKLIDTFIKRENYLRRHDQNSINMDVFDFKTGAVKGGTNNISTNGQVVGVVVNTNDPQPNDGNIVTALQVATHQ